MSTKIFNGYRLPVMSMLQQHQLLQDVEAKLKPVAQRLYAKATANVASKLMDYASAHGAEDVRKMLEVKAVGGVDTSVWAAATRHVWKQVKEAKESPYRSHWDFTCTAWFWPQSTQTLMRLQTEYLGEFRSALQGRTVVEDYVYFNNTDRPEEICEDEWDKRRQDWLAVTGVTPFEYEIVGDFARVLPEEMIVVFPSWEERLHRQAVDAAISESIQRNTDSDVSMNDIWEHMNWLTETKKGQACLRAWEDKLSHILHSNVTEETLKRPLSTFIRDDA